MSETLKDKVTPVLDEVRKMLQADGGDLDLVEVTDDGIVKVRLQGACRGCPGAAMTLKQGVERTLKERVEGVTAVENVM